MHERDEVPQLWTVPAPSPLSRLILPAVVVFAVIASLMVVALMEQGVRDTYDRTINARVPKTVPVAPGWVVDATPPRNGPTRKP